MFSVDGSGALSCVCHSFLTLPQTGWVKFYGMAMILPTVEGKVTSGKEL